MKLKKLLQEKVFFGKLESHYLKHKLSNEVLIPFVREKNAWCLERSLTKAQAFYAKKLLKEKGYKVAIFKLVDFKKKRFTLSFAKTYKALENIVTHTHYLSDYYGKFYDRAYLYSGYCGK